jgi:hypothetical protein
MTDPDTPRRTTADAQRARVEALDRRRAARVDAPAPPTRGIAPAPLRRRRRHAAARSRIGVAALSVATMFGLVGVMGLARQADSATPTAPDVSTTPVPVPVSEPAAAAAATVAQAPTTAAPPVALTARPSVRVTTPSTAVPVARTHGSR